MQISAAYQSALLTAARNSYGGTTRLLIVRDSTGTALSSHTIGLWSEIANGGFYATVGDDTNPANTGTPSTWEINVDGTAVHKDAIGSSVYLSTTLITAGVTVSVIGGQILVMRPLFEIADDEMGFVSEGATFAPRIGVTGVADLEWVFSDGTTETATITNNEITCNKNYSTTGKRLNILRCSDWSVINIINLGYSGADGGQDYSGTAYYHTNQNISEVLNLHLVENNLQRIFACDCPITYINLNGFSSLQIAEFYNAELQIANIAGCSNLLRYCVESCKLLFLDISDCVLLEDIRGAVNNFTTVVFGNSGAHIRHFCIRDNPQMTTNVDLSLMPALEDLYMYNCNQQGVLDTSYNPSLRSAFLSRNDYTQAILSNQYLGELTIMYVPLTQISIDCPLLKSLTMNGTNLSSSYIDYIAQTLDNNGLLNGTLNMRENNAPSSVGLAHISSLQSKGWTVSYVVGDVVATPVITPATGTVYASSQEVSISCATSGANVYYTTDGTDPDATDNLYSAPFSITVDTTVKAIGILTDYNNSSIAQSIIDIEPPRVAAPSISPSGGTFSSDQSVTISGADGATHYYRINSGSWVQYTTAVTVSANCTFEAYSTLTNYSDSNVTSVQFVIQSTPTLDAPTFNPTAGTYTGSQSVAITYDSNATTREYSLDNTNWSTYTAAVTVSASGTLYARSSANGYNSSSSSAAYTINLPTLSTPTFSPVAGSYSSTQTVTISYDTNATTREYSTDNTNWSSYTAAVEISASGTLYARSSASGYQSSSSSAAYTIGTSYRIYFKSTGQYCQMKAVLIDGATDTVTWHWSDGQVDTGAISTNRDFTTWADREHYMEITDPSTIYRFGLANTNTTNRVHSCWTNWTQFPNLYFVYFPVSAFKEIDVTGAPISQAHLASSTLTLEFNDSLLNDIAANYAAGIVGPTPRNIYLGTAGRSSASQASYDYLVNNFSFSISGTLV